MSMGRDLLSCGLRDVVYIEEIIETLSWGGVALGRNTKKVFGSGVLLGGTEHVYEVWSNLQGSLKQCLSCLIYVAVGTENYHSYSYDYFRRLAAEAPPRCPRRVRSPTISNVFC